MCPRVIWLGWAWHSCYPKRLRTPSLQIGTLGATDQAISSYQRAIQLKEPDVPARYLVRLGMAQLLSEKTADAESSDRNARRNRSSYLELPARNSIERTGCARALSG